MIAWRQNAAKKSFADVAHQMAPLCPVSLREQREVDVQAPEVQSPGEQVIPVVLDAGDRLESKVVQGGDDQGTDMEEREAVDRQQGLVLEPPQRMADQRGVQRGRRLLGWLALPSAGAWVRLLSRSSTGLRAGYEILRQTRVKEKPAPSCPARRRCTIPSR